MSTTEYNDWNKALLENVSESQVEGKALKGFIASSETGSKFQNGVASVEVRVLDKGGEGCLLKVCVRSFR